jgi:phosphohistidine swiveling domain-containing protein
LEFSDADVSSLSDAELADHVRALHAHLLETIRLHFRLHVSDMGPLGNLIVHLEDWGLDRRDTFRALVASSPATRDPADQLRAVADAVRTAGVEPTSVATLDDVRGASAEASNLLDQYLRFHGWRLTTGYDLEDRALIELPELIIASIRAAAGQTSGSGRQGTTTSTTTTTAVDAVAALRLEIPEEHRATFDDVVEDARLSYGLRDENGPLTYEWPAGLVRRALLECGSRMARTRTSTGAPLASPSEVFELEVDEICALLNGEPGPSREEIVRRRDERAAWALLDAPPRLGPEQALPPCSLFPEYLGRITRIVLTVVETLEADPNAEPLTGIGIGTTPYVGTARVVHDAVEAFTSVEPGDVIVAPYTAPTYNAVLAVAGAIITEEGGLLCHAAVLARELELPAVIGAADAMTRIPDGATVEVDPVAGRVRVLSA